MDKMTTCEFPQFSLLPWELRVMIWNLTFEERVLTVIAHYLKFPEYPGICHGYADQKAHDYEDDHKVSAMTFTARLGIHTVPTEPKQLSTPVPRCRGCHLYDSFPSCSHKSPAGPTALRVCRESRNHCLKHYELAFRPRLCNDGVSQSDPEFVSFFNSTPELHEPRLWVNFAKDTIFLLPVPQPWSYKQHHQLDGNCRPYNQKIQKVAIIGCAARMKMKTEEGLYLRKFLQDLRKYVNCREMSVYRPYSDGDSGVATDESRMVGGVSHLVRMSRLNSSEIGDPVSQRWAEGIPEAGGSRETIRIDVIVPVDQRDSLEKYQLKWRIHKYTSECHNS